MKAEPAVLSESRNKQPLSLVWKTTVTQKLSLINKNTKFTRITANITSASQKVHKFSNIFYSSFDKWTIYLKICARLKLKQENESTNLLFSKKLCLTIGFQNFLTCQVKKYKYLIFTNVPSCTKFVIRKGLKH